MASMDSTSHKSTVKAPWIPRCTLGPCVLGVYANGLCYQHYQQSLEAASTSTRKAAMDSNRDPNTCGTCGATVNAHTGLCPWYCNWDRAGAVSPAKAYSLPNRARQTVRAAITSNPRLLSVPYVQWKRATSSNTWHATVESHDLSWIRSGKVACGLAIVPGWVLTGAPGRGQALCRQCVKALETRYPLEA